jgi:hypothetical protein
MNGLLAPVPSSPGTLPFAVRRSNASGHEVMRHRMSSVRDASLHCTRTIPDRAPVSVSAHTARPDQDRGRASASTIGRSGPWLLSPRDIHTVGLVCALVLGLIAAVGRPTVREDAAARARHRLAVSAGRLVTDPHRCCPRLKSGAGIRSNNHPTHFSESARLEELDGDDDDPIVMPLRGLVPVLIHQALYVMDPSNAPAPTWAESPSLSFPTRRPLRC